tara:strand:- start:409 stop:795 length:387 start_codon:yes stop_codon:yes gene_type:complete
MPVASQIVQIDSIKKTILLDKKATIAQGNIVKQRNTLFDLYNKQVILIDSMRVESDSYRKAADTLIFVKTSLKQALKEQTTEMKFRNENFEIQEAFYKADLKAQKNKKWQFLGGGTLIGVLAMLLFGG